MDPKSKYGDEFFCVRQVFPKSDGSKHPFIDVGVCILPREDEASTLMDAWEKMRELAAWVCDEYRDEPKEVTYRIVVAWSARVRKHQGHILKVWNDMAGIREVAELKTPKECEARFGSGWTPFANWQKDAFKKAAQPGATDNPDDAQRLREEH